MQEWKKLKIWKNNISKTLCFTMFFLIKNLTYNFYQYNKSALYIEDSWQKDKTNRDKRNSVFIIIKKQSLYYLVVIKTFFWFKENYY